MTISQDVYLAAAIVDDVLITGETIAIIVIKFSE